MRFTIDFRVCHDMGCIHIHINVYNVARVTSLAEDRWISFTSVLDWQLDSLAQQVLGAEAVRALGSEF